MSLTPDARLRLDVHPRRISRWLAVAAVCIVAVGTLANVLIFQVLPSPDHKLSRLLNRLDIGHEPGLPQWFSSLLLLTAAVLLFVIAQHVRVNGLRFAWRWFGLATMFLLLATDEAICLHEMADATLHNWLDTGGWLYFAWVIPGAAAVALVGLAILPLLWHLDSRTRNGFIAAAVLFVGGAIGVEMVSGMVLDSMCTELPSGLIVQVKPFGMAAFTTCQAVEECCEMLGVVVLINALLHYIHTHVGALHVSVYPTVAKSPDFA